MTAPSHSASTVATARAPIVTGVVVAGDRRGRELGFPTANLVMPDDVRVEDGVWAAEVRVGRDRHIAAVSLGHRSTFYGSDGARLLEAHLLDFAGDLYGRTIVVDLRQLLRPQRRFGSAVALIRQMHRDVEAVRRWAQSAAPRSTPERPSPVPGRGRRRARLIAAAVQDALARDRLSHDEVAALSGVPLGFVRWAYPDLDQLRRVAGTVEVSHPF